MVAVGSTEAEAVATTVAVERAVAAVVPDWAVAASAAAQLMAAVRPRLAPFAALVGSAARAATSGRE